ncbi:MAG: ABC-2 transporter permease [Firmicutes bacterium]|nr:ABC-2 transporter permease [Bacillota bacterium]
MIGLLYKDVIYMKKMWKTVLLFSVFFIVFSFVQSNTISAMSFISIMIGGNFSMLPFNYDSYSKWNEYQYSFPISKKTVVCSRYLFGLLLFGICLLLNVVGLLLVQIEILLFTRPYAPITIQYVSAEILPLFFIPIMQAISFPLMYRFGAEKGRLYVICAIAVIIAIVMSVMKIWGGEITYSSVLITLVGVAVVMYVLSMLLSIHIEQKKMQSL